jgi:hypothetical protein
MRVEDAQREVRTVYVGGFVGQLVSAGVWLVSAAAASWLSLRHGAALLFFGGMLIFPSTQLALRLAGRPTALSPANPLRELAVEVAFLVPLLFPLAGAAALHRPEWFYPAAMIIVGAHYLPFSFLYGMRHFLVLGGLMLGLGMAIALWAPQLAAQGAFLTAALLTAFAFVGRSAESAARRVAVAVQA